MKCLIDVRKIIVDTKIEEQVSHFVKQCGANFESSAVLANDKVVIEMIERINGKWLIRNIHVFSQLEMAKIYLFDYVKPSLKDKIQTHLNV